MTTHFYFGTPEDASVINPDLEPGLPIDAIDCALSRAEAVLTMLSHQFDGEECSRISDEVIANVLWSVRGDLQQFRKLTDFAWQSEGLRDRKPRKAARRAK